MGSGSKRVSDNKKSKTTSIDAVETKEERPSKKLAPVVESADTKKSKKRTREEQVDAGHENKKRKKATEDTKPTKKSKSTKPPPPEDSSDEENIEEPVVDAADNEDVYLHGFSTDEDSSDDEEIGEAEPIDIQKLPTVMKDDLSVQKRLERAKKQHSSEKGVLYIGRIPHGFYEDQMKGYFSQFGNVTRLRLARNKKTGKSKHYGFIEFDSDSVAKIVSETMDNYLMMGHLLQCKVIPNDNIHPDLWIGANKKWKLIPRGRLARLAHNKTRTQDQQARVEQRLLKRQAEKEAKIKAAGIKYSLKGVGYAAVVA